MRNLGIAHSRLVPLLRQRTLFVSVFGCEEGANRLLQMLVREVTRATERVQVSRRRLPGHAEQLLVAKVVAQSLERFPCRVMARELDTHKLCSIQDNKRVIQQKSNFNDNENEQLNNRIISK